MIKTPSVGSLTPRRAAGSAGMTARRPAALFNRLRELFAPRVTTEPRSPAASRIPVAHRTVAGVSITPDTAVQVSTVWACLRYLSQTTAVLPWRVHREIAAGNEIAVRHPVDWLLHKRPNPELSSFQFRETLTHWACRWGNGYAEIEMDTVGRPHALWPIHPERVDPRRALADMVDDFGDEIPAGALYYEISSGTAAGKTILSMRRMFHIRGFGEGPVGVNVIAYAAQTIGWARAAQIFGAAFFGNGANLAGVVTTAAALSPEGLEALREEFERIFASGPRSAHKTAFVDAGMDYKQLGIDPEKGQFIETNQHLVEEICRFFGVPPHKVMHLLRATYTNIEHQSIEVVVDAITPWAKRFEDEADAKLLPARQGFYTKMNLRGLLRGDFKTQNEGFEIMRLNGVINANEWRELLDMNWMPDGVGGEKFIMQAHNTTLERIGAPAEAADEISAARDIETLARAMVRIDA